MIRIDIPPWVHRGFHEAVKTIRDAAVAAVEPIAEFLGFKDGTITVVSFHPSRIISDANIPKNAQFTQHIVKAVLGNGDITNAVFDAVRYGVSSKIQQHIQYAEGGEYPYGLPDFNVNLVSGNVTYFTDTLVAAQLTALGYTEVRRIGTPRITAVSDDLRGLAYLQNEQGFTYYYDLAGTIYGYQGIAVSGGVDVCRLVYYYYDEYDIRQETIHDISFPIGQYNPDDTNEYVFSGLYYRYVATVEKTSTGERFRYVYVYPHDWAAGNINLAVNEVDDYTKETPAFTFPVIPVRENNAYIVEEDPITSDPYLYPSVTKLLQFFALDLESIITTLEKNPQKATVSDIYITCAVDIYEKNSEVQTYCYLWFYLIYQLMGEDTYEFYTALSDAELDLARHNITITEANYNTNISFTYIRYEYIAGHIPDTTGEINTITVEFDFDPILKLERSVVYLRQDTYTHYSKLTVYGLQSIAWVNGSGDEKKIVLTQLVGEGGEAPQQAERKRFLIPLCPIIARRYGPQTIEQLLYRSFHMITFASIDHNYEWHQTEEFQNMFTTVLTVVALYFTAVTIGTTGGLWKFLGALALGYLFRELIRANPDLTDTQLGALIIVYAVATYAVAGGFSSDSKMSLADKLWFFVSSVSQAVVTYSQEETLRIQKELEDVHKSNKEEAERIQKILDGLDEEDASKTGINPLFISRHYPTVYESANTFYQRTLNTDVIKVSRNYATNFAASMLTLDASFLN